MFDDETEPVPDEAAEAADVAEAETAEVETAEIETETELETGPSEGATPADDGDVVHPVHSPPIDADVVRAIEAIVLVATEPVPTDQLAQLLELPLTVVNEPVSYTHLTLPTNREV